MLVCNAYCDSNSPLSDVREFRFSGEDHFRRELLSSIASLPHKTLDDDIDALINFLTEYKATTLPHLKSNPRFSKSSFNKLIEWLCDSGCAFSLSQNKITVFGDDKLFGDIESLLTFHAKIGELSIDKQETKLTIVANLDDHTI